MSVFYKDQKLVIEQPDSFTIILTAKESFIIDILKQQLLSALPKEGIVEDTIVVSPEEA